MLHPFLIVSLTVLLCQLPCAGFAQIAGAPEEIIITGKVAGPPLWQVRNGDNTLWIFGLLSPLPPDLELDTTRIDSLLAAADEVLSDPDFDTNESLGPVKLFRLYRQFRKIRVNDEGKTLQQVLPEDLYQRLLDVKARYGPRSNELWKMRPLMAAELLEGAALKSVGLGEDTGGITRQLQRLVRRHDVRFTEVVYSTDMKISSMMTLIAEVPFDAEVACLRSMLDTLEDDLDLLKQRAEAWAYGQVGALYASSSYGGAKQSCFRALTTPAPLQDVFRHASELWLTHAERALNENHNTFAMLDMQQLLSAEGPVETLRKRGYEVIEPL